MFDVIVMGLIGVALLPVIIVIMIILAHVWPLVFLAMGYIAFFKPNNN